MSIKKTLAGVTFAVGALTSMIADAWSIESTIPTRLAAKSSFIVLALSPQEQAYCQQEQAQLLQQLSQCTNDACRQQLRDAIAAHNARCQ